MKFAPFFLLLLIRSISSYADESIPSIEAITKNIIEVATKYAEAVSCGEINIESKDVAALSPWKKDGDPLDAEYLVLWNADMGCTGGTATFAVNAATVRINSSGIFYLDPHESSPNIIVSGGALLAYNKVIGASKNSITIEAGCGLASNMPDRSEICEQQKHFIIELIRHSKDADSCSKEEYWEPTGKAAKQIGL